jgi:hypothetical protein
MAWARRVKIEPARRSAGPVLPRAIISPGKIRMARRWTAFAFAFLVTPLIALAQEEATVAELRMAMDSGRISARRLVEQYLARLEEIDRRGPALHAVIEINPESLESRRSSRW